LRATLNEKREVSPAGPGAVAGFGEARRQTSRTGFAHRGRTVRSCNFDATAERDRFCRTCGEKGVLASIAASTSLNARPDRMILAAPAARTLHVGTYRRNLQAVSRPGGTIRTRATAAGDEKRATGMLTTKDPPLTASMFPPRPLGRDKPIEADDHVMGRTLIASAEPQKLRLPGCERPPASEGLRANARLIRIRRVLAKSRRHCPQIRTPNLRIPERRQSRFQGWSGRGSRLYVIAGFRMGVGFIVPGVPC